MGGVNGLAGHELIHKRQVHNKLLGLWTYSKMLYSHFSLEHGSGHHRNVATPEDPATAKQGESFYEFFPRTVSGGFRETYLREVDRIEAEYAERCRDQESNAPLIVHVTENRMYLFTALHVGMVVAIYVIFGWKAVLF